MLQLLCLSDQVDEFILVWIFAFVVGLAHEFVVELVESTYLMLFLFVDIVALLDLYFISDDQVLFVVLLSERLLPLLLKQLNLGLGVELVNPDPGNFIKNILEFNLLLLNVLADLMGLLEEVGCSLFNGGMLTLLINETLIELFGLSVQLHDVALHQIHGIFH